jgi:hypothetical protein
MVQSWWCKASSTAESDGTRNLKSGQRSSIGALYYFIFVSGNWGFMTQSETCRWACLDSVVKMHCLGISVSSELRMAEDSGKETPPTVDSLSRHITVSWFFR